MTALDEYRFTDTDVRRDSGLAQLAASYLGRYAGEFQPLVACKLQLADGRPLNVAQVRMVLNCMRVDPFVTWEPCQVTQAVATVLPLRRRRLERVAARQVRELPVKWKKRFGVAALTGRARRIHLLHPDSGIRYVPANGRSLDASLDPHLRWWCGDCVSHGQSFLREDRYHYEYAIQLYSAEEVFQLFAEGDGWKWCGSCAAIMLRRLKRGADRDGE